MATQFRQHSDIHGIKINDFEYLISQFADDMDMYIPYDVMVLNAVLTLFDHIEANTGLQISYDKTILYRIGSLEKSNSKLITCRKVKWANHSINTLGIDLYHSEKDQMLNYDTIMLKLETIANLWYYRTLRLFGKILIVNVLMSSLFIYRMQVLAPIDKDSLNKIDQVIEKFLWKGKRAKLSLHVLRKEKQYGGGWLM